MRVDLTDPGIDHLLRRVQDGVVARWQLLAAGASPDDIRRMLRRRELVLDHPGVYRNHTGAPSYEQREWVAVLSAWPAALGGESALRRRPGVIEVALAHGRSVTTPTGTVVRRVVDLDARTDPRSTPPRILREHALVDVMARRIGRDDFAGAFAVAAETCHDRTTSPARVRAVLATRSRVPGRPVIDALLTDLADGACSVLEREYLHRVERAHGLPRGRRQARSRATGATTLSDVRYDAHGGALMCAEVAAGATGAHTRHGSG